MRNLLIRWKINPPDSLNPPLYDCPPLLCWVLPDLVHYHCIPISADLSAVVKGLQAVKANHQHDFLKDARMTHQLPVLLF